jgi:hypothetical protein
VQNQFSNFLQEDNIERKRRESPPDRYFSAFDILLGFVCRERKAAVYRGVDSDFRQNLRGNPKDGGLSKSFCKA